MQPAELAARLLARDRSAVAEALNGIEDQRPEPRAQARELLDRLEGQGDSALRVGVTGAPGAGKSSLIEAFVVECRSRDLSVGIIAVDPSSQRSGGALLGDRLRVRSGSKDPSVFLRSMAARNRLGGLADATRAGIEIMATVFDVVFVETVGVGQSESEVAQLVDTLVFVAQPGAGDTIQFMKAGILEMPDVFVVNKADLGPQAGRTRHELLSGLGLSERHGDGWVPPVLLASAQDRKGADAIVDAIEAHRRHLEEASLLEPRRSRGRSASVLVSLAARYGEHGCNQIGGPEAILRRIEAMTSSSYLSLVEDLGREIEERLKAVDAGNTTGRPSHVKARHQ